MYFPQLKALKQKAVTVTAFGGLNRTAAPGKGEFAAMENMTADGYPTLMPRPGRQKLTTTACSGMIAKDALCYVNGSAFVINGYPVEMGLTPGEKQLVSMGAYVVIFPDKKYINTLELTDFGSLEATFIDYTGARVAPCDADGQILTDLIVSSETPQSPENGQYWFDTDADVLRQYSAAGESWVDTAGYLRIQATGIGTLFGVGDGVTVSGIKEPALQKLNAAARICARGEDFVVIPGAVGAAVNLQPEQLKLERLVPDMDFVIESDNRLWGCRYGLDRAGKAVNAIYACKLGDFKNWQCFQGISTDSYQVSLGADGPFTGAAVYLGQPVFFRETCLHKVYGSYPAEFRLQTTACRGVQQGSGKSLALVDGVLYYKSPDGVCAYDGSLPVCISQKLGKDCYHSAVSGSLGSKLYISMTHREGKSHLFVYDALRKLWHREDSLPIRHFCTRGEQLFAADGAHIWILAGGEDTETVNWMAQTGPVAAEDPRKRYISRIVPRLLLETGSRVRFFVRYDGAGPWQLLGTATGTGLRSFSLPMRIHRCDFMELRIEGRGKAKIYSLTLIKEQGSELL